MIIANDVSNPEIGFNSDQNTVSVITMNGCRQLGPMTKNSLAIMLIEMIFNRWQEQAQESIDADT